MKKYLLPLIVIFILLAAVPANARVPKLAELPLQTEVSQGDITWTFSAPVRVGRFVNGDYYIVGPCTIKAISPAPVLDTVNLQNCRHGSILNPPARHRKMAYDGQMRRGQLVDTSIWARVPLSMQPGDLLVSSISAENRQGKCFMGLRSKLSFTKSYSALTCLEAPVATDTFRPGFSDRGMNFYYADQLRLDRLHRLAKTPDTPNINVWADIFRQPWAGVCRLSASNAQDYQPQYSVEAVRAESIASLLLNLDFTDEEKRPLLINFIQYGIDRYSLIRAGGFVEGRKAVGGHGNGDKWGITFAGILLDDYDMSHLNEKYPEVRFGQDMQTAFVKDMPEGMQTSWNGSDVVYTGMYGMWKGEPVGKEPQHLPYEHKPPRDWAASTFTYGPGKTRTRFAGENYRRGQNSPSWVGAALCIRIMGAEEEYGHPAFCAYVDRWMTIDDAPLRKEIKAAQIPEDETDLDAMKAGRAWDPFVESMWRAYRYNLP